MIGKIEEKKSLKKLFKDAFVLNSITNSMLLLTIG